MQSARQAQAIGTMIYVACIAVAIASGALALTMCIMRGFEQSGHQLLQGIHAPITISSHGYALQQDAIEPILASEFPDIKGFSFRLLQHGIIKDPLSGELSTPVQLYGVLATHEEKTSSLACYITQTLMPTKELTHIIKDNQVLIGERLAKQFELKVGDTIELMYAPENHAASNKLYLASTALVVHGIFKTGLEDIDAGTIYCALPFLASLFPDSSIDHIAIQPLPSTNQTQLIKQLHDRFGLEVYSWQSLYPALVSALELEKYAMFLILSLIVLIASMTILALLYMQIQHKRSDIAIMHAMGIPDRTITHIFIIMGICIAAISASIGLATAALVAWALDTYQLIPLPDTYLISHLPVALELHVFIGIFLFVVFIALIATWIPCKTLHTVTIARLLRSQV